MLKTKEEIKKVTCVWGSFDSDDFVLEPYVDGDEEEDIGEVFYIKKVKKVT
jgi:hypothetical protein